MLKKIMLCGLILLFVNCAIATYDEQYEAEIANDIARQYEEQQEKEAYEYELYCENHGPEDGCPSRTAGSDLGVFGWVFMIGIFAFVIYYIKTH